MKMHDNTLYITTQKAYLACQGTNVLVRVGKETRLRLPVHTIGSIVCFGNVGCSPFLMGMCGREGVGISFLTESGRFLARLLGPQSGNVRLRRAQHKATADPIKAAEIARVLISAKITNCRTVLQRALRDHGQQMAGRTQVEAALARLASLLEELEQPLSVDRARGVEGEAAGLYFSVFDSLVLAQKETFFMRDRSRRPPRDNMNALLSFLYAILTNDIVAACESVGLDPQMGFLHADRPGRPSLALDLVEEFRPVIADRLALSLVNRQQVSAGGFPVRESGAVNMSDETRKAVLIAYQKRKAEELVHPFLGEKMTIGLLFHIQARLLTRWLRGELDAYPAFIWK